MFFTKPFHLKFLLRAGVAAFFINITPSAFAYSGEDLLNGNPWHHADITCRAILGDLGCLNKRNGVYEGELGFSKSAAKAIAWHADYIDSYIYSPLWWISAGKSGQPVRNMRRRYVAGMSNYWGLASLHFDDLNSTKDVHKAWQRYMAGTLIALKWAAENDDVQSAYNILGVGLHANQDFYSHSTWINSPIRRKYTYLEMRPNTIQASSLETGAYESSVAAVQHGKYDLACTVYERPNIKPLMTLFCSDVLPTANINFCTKIRRCEQGSASDSQIRIGGLF